jgi:hypothetical protein
MLVLGVSVPSGAVEELVEVASVRVVSMRKVLAKRERKRRVGW